MMKNETIYVATITKSADYESDVTLEMEGFTYFSDAEGFMLEKGMERSELGNWILTAAPYSVEGKITELRVK